MRCCKILIQAVSWLPGTFIHELAHYLAAMLFAHPTGFHLIPRIEGDSVVFGSVSCKARYRAAFFFVAVAPLVWWYILFRWLVHMGVVSIAPAAGSGIHIRPGILFENPGSHLARIWLIAQLLWAGRLSAADLKTAASGLFSFSGVAMVLAAAVLYKTVF